MNDTPMFCRQCQETFGNTGCTRGGMCGKRSETSNHMDVLVSGLEDLAKEAEPTKELGRFVTHALFMTLTNANFDDARLRQAIAACERRLGHIVTHKTPWAFAVKSADVCSLKEVVLFGLKGIAAYAHHASVLGKEEEPVYAFVFRALRAMGEEKGVDELTALVMDTGRMAVRVMALLDAANTEAYGKPTATEVRLDTGTRPGILVSGHDLRDLAELLEQTAGTGVDVYTHGEMLPAHCYPYFRKCPHLRGNYGGAWHQQQKDFAMFNGAILMTSNCIVPVLDSYRDRIFTTGVAGYPGVPHVSDRRSGRQKDFTAVIERAKRCSAPTPLETGTVVGGFARDQILAYKDKIVEAVKSGKIRRFVVMAGCDGRHLTRDYYTRVATSLPDDTVILTAGCAKYRYIKLVKGEIDGIPRVLDAGQCNDSYSLAVVALALKDALGLDDVNRLPIAFDIAWYEQKAVAVVLALLSLGFRNLRIGPTPPAFLSTGILKVLTRRFGIKVVTTPEDDIRDILA